MSNSTGGTYEVEDHANGKKVKDTVSENIATVSHRTCIADRPCEGLAPKHLVHGASSFQNSEALLSGSHFTSGGLTGLGPLVRHEKQGREEWLMYASRTSGVNLI